MTMGKGRGAWRVCVTRPTSSKEAGRQAGRKAGRRAGEEGRWGVRKSGGEKKDSRGESVFSVLSLWSGRSSFFRGKMKRGGREGEGDEDEEGGG